MAAPNRETVNSAVDEVDADLINDPDQKGEDYFGDRYVLNATLWALYHVFPDDRTVHVLQVDRIGIDRPHDATP